MKFWERLASFINNNPVGERDRFFMAMLKPLGIEKGKPFSPNERQTRILKDGLRTGEAMARKELGPGSQYIQTFKDAGGQWIDGSHTYRLRIQPTFQPSSSGH